MLKINAERLSETLESLGRIGETPEGMQRIAFSPADVEGREFVQDLMAKAGLSVRVDAAGNVIGRKEGAVADLPAIGMGSHTDTVPKGGKYDGALGVMGAIECVQTLKDSGVTTRHPIEVLIYTNEEGTQFRRWLYGSRAMVGLLEEDDLTAVDEIGVSIGERLKDVGGDVTKIMEAARSSDEFSAYHGTAHRARPRPAPDRRCHRRRNGNHRQDRHERIRQGHGQPRRHHAHGPPPRRSCWPPPTSYRQSTQ